MKVWEWFGVEGWWRKKVGERVGWCLKEGVVEKMVEKGLVGLFGREKVNVLKVNVGLEEGKGRVK